MTHQGAWLQPCIGEYQADVPQNRTQMAELGVGSQKPLQLNKKNWIKNKVKEKEIADTSGVDGWEETIKDYNNLSFLPQLVCSVSQDYPS